MGKIISPVVCSASLLYLPYPGIETVYHRQLFGEDEDASELDDAEKQGENGELATLFFDLCRKANLSIFSSGDRYPATGSAGVPCRSGGAACGQWTGCGSHGVPKGVESPSLTRCPAEPTPHRCFRQTFTTCLR